MPAIFSVLFFWLAAVVLETTLFSAISWFQPNLLLLSATLFCLRWRGSETHFIALFFGLTADCFSALPFGIFSISFFTLSFALKSYGIRVFQGSYTAFSIISGVTALLHNLFVAFLLSLIFSRNYFSLIWFKDTLLVEIIPTMILAMPGFQALVTIEERYKIRLSERKF